MKEENKNKPKLSDEQRIELAELLLKKSEIKL